jgi:hypothetical protein
MKQNAEADPPPIEREIMAMTQELRHLKGRVLPQEKEAALRKAATACQDPTMMARWKRKLRKSGA